MTDVVALTLAEKASLASGADFWHTTACERAGLPPLLLTDGPHGVRKQASDTASVDLARAVPATCFPTAATLASTWDRALLQRVG